MVVTRRSARLAGGEQNELSSDPEVDKNKAVINGTPVIANGKSIDTNKKDKSEKSHPMVFVVFVSLLLDLLAFTMILPLLPALMELYRNHDDSGLFQWLLTRVQYFQQILGVPDRYNSVLFGGFLGSLFSFLQFVASPIMGAFSDRFGRKPAILISLIGISASYVLWVLSNNFALFVLARIVGGLSKGNVSLFLAVIADVSTSATRGKGMALVGIAFSVGFVLGPLIGALFAQWSYTQEGQNWFVVPASLALALAVLDILFVAFAFKETLPENKRAKSVATSVSQAFAYINVMDLLKFSAVSNLSKQSQSQLRRIGLTYFLYLFLYSGLEFTLTFLTYHAFGYTPMEQGKMFAFIGITMAVLQGGYVRKVPEEKTHSAARLGLLLTVPSFQFVGLAASPSMPYRQVFLYIGLFLFAASTAFVVPCMSTLAAQHGSHDQKGKVMGILRSLGALARALGPVVASTAYWSVGSSFTYIFGACLLTIPWYLIKKAK
ncbi:major facilitator superfamily domain-containing protein 10 [Neocloeon triangulifer]|uniref:major facilitator superfamily domain-containing protein 10 n=1 Tax=Neocloeon triangulifer TaxID=2078957 RepID=UPI00286F8D54|nr:major facilitator superfamily domain-containing protein 10 [Neocloeon triangulifer]